MAEENHGNRHREPAYYCTVFHCNATDVLTLSIKPMALKLAKPRRQPHSFVCHTATPS
jgi:hypothetical protein